jgi:hypothetical protein
MFMILVMALRVADHLGQERRTDGP